MEICKNALGSNQLQPTVLEQNSEVEVKITLYGRNILGIMTGDFKF